MKFRDFSRLVRNLLHKHLEYVAMHPSEFSLVPGAFSRIRKCPLDKLLRIIFCMTRSNLPDVLFDSLLPDEKDMPFSLPAFIQQRRKLLISAFRYIFSHVLEDLSAIIRPRTYHGYRLLACDGSDFPMASELIPPGDHDGIQQRVQRRMLHVNALYDVMNNLYVAVTAKPKMLCSERDELLNLVDAPVPGMQNDWLTKAIIICDRGYEGYHVLARLIQSGARFVIRVQGRNGNGILGRSAPPFALPDGIIDVPIRIRVRKNDRGIYKRSHATITGSAKDEAISLRVITRKLPDGELEYLLTNLPREKFTRRQIAYIYGKRWNVETSFRHLKYGIGGIIFHSRKREFQEMELYASLTLYNCVSSLVGYVKVPRRDNTYQYKASFSAAVNKCLYYLMVPDIRSFNLEEWLRDYLMPTRKKRTYPRKVKIRTPREFHYRR